MTHSARHSSLPIRPDFILVRREHAHVDCYWCRKILKLCNGTLTLAQISRSLYLPLQVSQKLVRRALERGWAEIVSPTPAALTFWSKVQEVLTEVVGSHSELLTNQASRMIRLQGQALTRRDSVHFLIALELAATEEQRLWLIPHLDRLRQHLPD